MYCPDVTVAVNVWTVAPVAESCSKIICVGTLLPPLIVPDIENSEFNTDSVYCEEYVLPFSAVELIVIL